MLSRTERMQHKGKNIFRVVMSISIAVLSVIVVFVGAMVIEVPPWGKVSGQASVNMGSGGQQGAINLEVISAKVAAAAPTKNIIVNLPSCTLGLYSDNTLVKEYTVAIGKPTTVTPLGNFTITQKEVNPWWYPPRRNYGVPSGPDNPLGYRWLEFAPLYGIHGTNAPSFIGSAASNGCIRMYEADVEELFELVPVGVPVKVTYELVKIQFESDGQATIGVYPDVYGYKSYNLILAEAKDKLAANGLANILSDEALEKIIREHTGRQVPVVKVFKCKVNGVLANDMVIIWQETTLVPVWPVATAVNMDVVWNETNHMITSGERMVPGVIKNNRIYATAANVQSLFDGFQLWQQDETCMEFVVPAKRK